MAMILMAMVMAMKLEALGALRALESTCVKGWAALESTGSTGH